MEKKIHLQGVGLVKATEAENITVGTTLVWNYGNTSEVSDIKPRGAKQLVITEVLPSGVYERIVGRKRLLAYV